MKTIFAILCLGLNLVAIAGNEHPNNAPINPDDRPIGRPTDISENDQILANSVVNFLLDPKHAKAVQSFKSASKCILNISEEYKNDQNGYLSVYRIKSSASSCSKNPQANYELQLIYSLAKGGKQSSVVKFFKLTKPVDAGLVKSPATVLVVKTLLDPRLTAKLNQFSKLVDVESITITSIDFAKQLISLRLFGYIRDESCNVDGASKQLNIKVIPTNKGTAIETELENFGPCD